MYQNFKGKNRFHSSSQHYTIKPVQEDLPLQIHKGGNPKQGVLQPTDSTLLSWWYLSAIPWKIYHRHPTTIPSSSISNQIWYFQRCNKPILHTLIFCIWLTWNMQVQGTKWSNNITRLSHNAQQNKQACHLQNTHQYDTIAPCQHVHTEQQTAYTIQVSLKDHLASSLYNMQDVKYSLNAESR